MKTALLALVVAAVLTVILGYLFIPLLHRLKFGQTVREDGPSGHLKKTGTPTMGGLIFLLAALLAVLIFVPFSQELLVALLITLGFGLIGFIDDFIKVVMKRSLGLTAWEKLLGQFILAACLLYAACALLGRGTDIIIPISGRSVELGFFYYIICAVYIVGMSNAVNLTDGLDGLAGGVSFLVLIADMLICLLAVKNAPIAGLDYAALAALAAALAGGCLGFLWHNHYPAKVFMGDTGSLALGGAVMAFCVLTKTEIVLLVLGLVYLAEAVSVILQVGSFKLTGKRIFLMSPLHHHFEMKGWAETKVVKVFYVVELILMLLALLLVTI